MGNGLPGLATLSARHILDARGAHNVIAAHLEKSQTVEIGQRGKRAVDPNSMSFALMNDPGLLETFGRAAAADILLGNNDRFVGKIDLENAMVDPLARTSIRLIDCRSGRPRRPAGHAPSTR